MNILLTSVGRRTYMVDYFKKALNGLGDVHAGNSVLTHSLKCANRYVLTPNIYEENYIEFILYYCIDNNIKAIIPLFDIDIPVLAKHRNVFTEYGIKLIVSSLDFVTICNDKWKTYQFLNINKINTPQSFICLNDVEKALLEKRIDFPLIVKPRWGMGSIGVFVAENEEELKVFYNKTLKAIKESYLKHESKNDLLHAVLIQEMIRGYEYGLDIINDLNGNNIAVIPKRKLAMRAGETDIARIENLPFLVELGKTLSLFTGHIANLDVDCFVSNGTNYVLEMNCRFGGQYPFSHLAGVNLPKQIILWLQNKQTDMSLFQFEDQCTICKDIIPTRL